MKNLYLNLLSIFILSLSVHAQVNVQWESRYTSTGNATDVATDMVIDAAGNVYVTGTSFNSGTGFDLQTVKYDNAGTQLWAMTYNGPNSSIDEARAIALDGSGNVYVAGVVHVSGADYDAVLIKYDNNGLFQWAQTYNAQGYYDQARGVAVDGNGDIYIVGSIMYNSAGTDIDYLIAKYNTNGVLQWSDQYSSAGSNADEAYAIAIDGSNNPYITGVSQGTGLSNNLDYYTIKYNSTGTLQWQMRYDYNGGFDQPTTIKISPNGNVIVGGFAYFDAFEDANYGVVAYNSNGVFQWDYAYNGTGSDYDKLNDLIVDASNNIYITGRSIGNGSAEDFLSLKLNQGGVYQWEARFSGTGGNYDEAFAITEGSSGSIYVTGYSFEPATNNDFLTLKYTPTGLLTWSTRFNATANNSDQALAIEIDPQENIYVTGTSNGGSTSGQDFSTIKYCQLLVDAGQDDTLCIGETAQLNAVGGSGHTWSLISGDPIVVGTNFSCTSCSNPTASPSVTSSYLVTGTNANGCTDVDTVTVVVNPLPGPNIYSVGPTSVCPGDSVILYTDEPGSYTWGPNNETNDTIVAYTGGSYTLTVVDSMGCQNSTSESVTIFNLPSIDAGLGGTICSGDSIPLTASGGNTYVWHSDSVLTDSTIANPNAFPTMTQWFYVVGTDVNGCSNNDSVEVIVNPTPAIPTITEVYINSELISSYGSGNQWFFNGNSITGATNQVYVYADSGIGYYQVLYTNASGCSAISDTFFVDSVYTVDTNYIDERMLSNIQFYPNPVGNELNIILETVGPDAEIFIYNSLGQLVERERLLSSYFKLNTSQLPTGIYEARIISEGKIGHVRFKKE
jgi:uncharacterized delta-60 repeat protein